MPVTQLNKVVLPAPLGPISARISPRSTLNDTSPTARKPPKSMVKLRTERAALLGIFNFIFRRRAAEESVGAENHHRDHQRAEGKHSVVGKDAQIFRN